MDPQKVLALCREHAGAEAEYDVERVLATLVAQPRFEFFPLRKHITGRASIEKFYREQYPKFGPTVAGYEVIGEWTNEIAALQEYTIDVTEADGSTTRSYLISLMPGAAHTRLLPRQPLSCPQRFVP